MPIASPIESRMSYEQPKATSVPAADDLDATFSSLKLGGTDPSNGSSAPTQVPQGTVVEKEDINHDDDRTNLSSSSTKPNSCDGKSTVSVATFALDEKESLRPDDSASVQAIEEEDLASGPATGAPNSRVGSEAGVRPFRDQYREISERMIGRPMPGSSGVLPRVYVPGAPIPGAIAQAGEPVQPVQRPLPNSANAQNPSIPYGLPQHPDEKLLEAMTSPKDRLFLLQLEQKIIAFVKDSKYDTRPMSAFGEMLTVVAMI